MSRYTRRVAELSNADHVEINKRCIKSLTDAELQDIENQVGQPFPSDYREFLCHYGGIMIGPNQCRRAALYHLGDYQWGRASISFCFDGSEVLSQWKLSQEYRYIPPELLPIGGDGNVQLFLAIAGEHTGSVYQFYPTVFPETLDYYPELELVARSFDDFFQMLKPLEERYYEKPEHYEQERQEISRVVEQLLLTSPRPDNHYTQIMSELNARFVYATLGEDSKSLSEVEIQSLENEFGHALPADYREFLRSFGGYSFIPSPRDDGYYCPPKTYPLLYPAHWQSSIGVGHYAPITFFHGHMRRDYHDLLAHYQRLKEYLSHDMLPIADAGQLCLKLAGEDSGAIYRPEDNVQEYSLSECYVQPDSPLPEEMFTFIAPSFDAFMTSLRTGNSGEIIY